MQGGSDGVFVQLCLDEYPQNIKDLQCDSQAIIQVDNIVIDIPVRNSNGHMRRVILIVWAGL